MTKALSAFSEEGAVKELLEGESFVHWFGGLAEGYMEHATEHSETFAGLMAKALQKSCVCGIQWNSPRGTDRGSDRKASGE